MDESEFTDLANGGTLRFSLFQVFLQRINGCRYGFLLFKKIDFLGNLESWW